VQKTAIGVGNRLLHLGDRESFRQQRARAFQRHEAIRLHGQSLIEVGRESKIYFDGVRSRKPIKRVAFPSECWISHATRLPGLCGRSVAGTARARLVLALRALHHRSLAGGRSRSRRRSRRRQSPLRGGDHGGLQEEHARSSQNDASGKYIHLHTLAVALHGELSSSGF
jgi:hypothetical protein